MVWVHGVWLHRATWIQSPRCKNPLSHPVNLVFLHKLSYLFYIIWNCDAGKCEEVNDEWEKWCIQFHSGDTRIGEWKESDRLGRYRIEFWWVGKTWQSLMMAWWEIIILKKWWVVYISWVWSTLIGFLTSGLGWEKLWRD